MLYENKEDYFYSYCETNPLEYPLHLHQYIEILHVIRGTVDMQIGTEKYRINAGELALIFPNVLHDYHTLSGVSETQLHIINCYLHILPQHQKQLRSMIPKRPLLKAEQLHEDVLYAEKRLFEMHPGENNEILAGTLVGLMLCRLFPEAQLTKYEKQPSQGLPTDILTYIANHYREDISLSSVAAQFGLGKFSLSRIFSNVLGISFTRYVNSLRITYAEHLLADTDRNILDVAMECGYHNQQTFNRAFKDFSSCTPKEYRAKHPGHIDISLECFFTGEEKERE